MSERVLVVPTRVFHDAGLFQGFHANAGHYLPRLLDSAHLQFRPRDEVETDPSYKQIIPYVVFHKGDQVYHYLRGKAGGEKRLHALRSIGVGGHISELDAGTVDLYRTGMLRELAEEVYLETAYRESVLGLINDDATAVGQVHLGIVHLFELEAPHVRRREETLTEDGFAPLAELRKQAHEFETWSQIALEAISRAPGFGSGSP